MSFLTEYRNRRAVRAAVREDLRLLDAKIPEEVFHSMSVPLPKAPETLDGQTVTGFYKNVQMMVSDAREQGRKVTSAAQRLSDIIGVVPPPLPRPANRKA